MYNTEALTIVTWGRGRGRFRGMGRGNVTNKTEKWTKKAVDKYGNVRKCYICGSE